jgi:hypothetical protein
MFDSSWYQTDEVEELDVAVYEREALDDDEDLGDAGVSRNNSNGGAGGSAVTAQS